MVLMSATLDAERFGAADVKVLSVPTRPRHPVETFWLEDLITGGGDNDNLMDTTKGATLPLELRELAGSLLAEQDELLKKELEDALYEEASSYTTDDDAGFKENDPRRSRIQVLEKAVSMRRRKQKMNQTDDP